MIPIPPPPPVADRPEREEVVVAACTAITNASTTQAAPTARAAPSPKEVSTDKRRSKSRTCVDLACWYPAAECPLHLQSGGRREVVRKIKTAAERAAERALVLAAPATRIPAAYIEADRALVAPRDEVD